MNIKILNSFQEVVHGKVVVFNKDDVVEVNDTDANRFISAQNAEKVEDGGASDSEGGEPESEGGEKKRDWPF